MKESKQQISESRRRFLRDATVSGGAAAAAAAIPGMAIADTAETDGPAKPNEGYRLTQHILDYYKSAAS